MTLQGDSTHGRQIHQGGLDLSAPALHKARPEVTAETTPGMGSCSTDGNTSTSCTHSAGTSLCGASARGRAQAPSDLSPTHTGPSAK